ncbi:MAG: DNA glycosylase AlkZ-like family protein [Promethearchaeota archaeon]
MTEFDIRQINQFVLSRNYLFKKNKSNNLVNIIEEICGLHATGIMEPYISLFNRIDNLKKEQFEQELYIRKNLARIRGIRKTLFIHTKNMIPIVYSATKHLTEKLFDKYLKVRGISPADYETLSNKVLALLSQKEMSTSEIKKSLKSQKDIGAVISIMSDKMLLIRSKPIKSWKDRRIRFALFKKCFPDIDIDKYSESKAIRLLIEKYLKSYGPSTENDIIWWTGLTKTKIMKALNELKRMIRIIKISNFASQYLILDSDFESLKNFELTSNKVVNLLPQLDPYLMGYKDRERYIEYNNYEFVFDRSGNITSTILLDGKIIGVWETLEKPNPLIKLLFFGKIEEDILDKVYREAYRIGKFILDQEVVIEECHQMIPLTKRTAGGFMTPLKDCN